MHSVLCQNQDGQDYRRILVENSPLWHYRQYFLTLHENRIGGSAYTSSKLNIKKQCLVKYTIKKRGVQISFNVYLFLRLVEINSFSDQFPDFFYCLTGSDASGKIRHISTTTVFIFFKDDYIFHVWLLTALASQNRCYVLLSKFTSGLTSVPLTLTAKPVLPPNPRPPGKL